MKLLLIDRPKDINIIKRRDVEYFGPWAQPINSPEDLLKPAFEPYSDPEVISRANISATGIANEIIKKASTVMPDLTEVRAGERFWRSYLGYHLFSLAVIFEDIKARQASLPENDYIIGIPDRDYTQDYYPYSWSDAWKYIFYDDYFRWKAITLYLKRFYKNYEPVVYSRFTRERALHGFDDFSARIMSLNKRRLFNKIAFSPHRLLAILMKLKGVTINTESLLWDLYNMQAYDFKAFRAELFLGEFLPKIKLPLLQVDIRKREALCNSLPAPYGELLILSLPLIAFEGLKFQFEQIKNALPQFKNVERLYTHGLAFVSGDPKRALFSCLADNGKKAILIQHGGSSYLVNSGKFLEAMADEYISWGPGYLNNRNAVNTRNARFMPSIYLSKIRDNVHVCASHNNSWRALLVVFEETRYNKCLYHPMFADMAYDYFARQKILFEFFCTREGNAIKVHPWTFGWGQADWIKKRYPKATLLVEGKFIDYAARSEIVVIDYQGTSILEMLVMNKPFLVTWSRKWFKSERIFEDNIDKLIEVGIFYEDPVSLTEAYRKISLSGIADWWSDRKRQRIVKEMADVFALTSDNIQGDWNREFGENSRRGS